ncbi:AAA family ATPase [Erwinia rhapontici]|uniref:AAA family ATPase n=1 Tax=Erwinia rhapontici TaxID=55212 RepID=UPI0021676F0F|nr:ATP-binding protein [Erwinia rhapontici]MCS3607243.1 Holliday junction resolvasome RuvABC ATP-dependent DNA helicase subunit [Erwinia rhapontici]
MKNPKPVELFQSSDRDNTLQLWIFRLFFRLGAHKQFMTQHGFNNQPLAEYLNLTKYEDEEFTHQLQQSILETLRMRHAELEQQIPMGTPSEFQEALGNLARRVGLSPAESLILEFTLQLHQEQLLDDTADYLGLMTSAKVYRALAAVLDLTEDEVRFALGPLSLLTKTDLVNLETNGAYTLRNKLEPFSPTLSERLSAGETDPVRLLRGMISLCEPAHLKFEDYQHIPAINMMRQWLYYAFQSSRIGVNILIHGQPGTGKSQLCRLLAEELNSEIYEVTSENESARPINGSRRLRAWRAAQRFFGGEKALILLDEAEDVFSECPGSLTTPPHPVPKAWVNRLLEENRAPTLWVSNEISEMDPAYIRQFDIVLELTAPHRAERETILLEACGATLSNNDISQLASIPYLAPAVVKRAGTILQSIKDKLDEERHAHYLMFLINSTLKAQGHLPIKLKTKAKSPEFYDTAFINSDCPLGKIAATLSPADSARFCLYGPPGTGKTAWAYWLAEQLKLPVIEKKSSQLFCRYVVENEQNIASGFEQTRRDKAVLLIDEVDSFLTAREECRQSWEISCVNEMLSQMEHFDGIFITTTNRFDVLDAAALRRFDLKVRFNFMCDYQAVALLNLYCKQLKLDEPSPSAINELARLSSLTPRDFFVVSRQHTFRPLTSANAFVAALKAECWVKKREETAISFLH